MGLITKNIRELMKDRVFKLEERLAFAKAREVQFVDRARFSGVSEDDVNEYWKNLVFEIEEELAFIRR